MNRRRMVGLGWGDGELNDNWMQTQIVSSFFQVVLNGEHNVFDQIDLEGFQKFA